MFEDYHSQPGGVSKIPCCVLEMRETNDSEDLDEHIVRDS